MLSQDFLAFVSGYANIPIMVRVPNGMGTHSLYPKFWNVSLLRLMLSYVHENYNEK